MQTDTLSVQQLVEKLGRRRCSPACSELIQVKKVAFLLSFLQMWTKTEKPAWLSQSAVSVWFFNYQRKEMQIRRFFFCLGHSSILRTNLDSEVDGILNILFYNAGN